jgi:ribosomal protein S18 acetylase RimI-like enzyme
MMATSLRTSGLLPRVWKNSSKAFTSVETTERSSSPESSSFDRVPREAVTFNSPDIVAPYSVTMSGMIRRANLDDVEPLMQLESKLFDNAMNTRMIEYELVKGQGWIYGDMLGYILVRFDAGLMDITRLGVDSDHRRQGIGRKLLELALAESANAMLTVKKDNVAAILLYRQYGFEVVAHMVAAGAFVMRRRVKAA